jgi:hypothetical protein
MIWNISEKLRQRRQPVRAIVVTYARPALEVCPVRRESVSTLELEKIVLIQKYSSI